MENHAKKGTDQPTSLHVRTLIDSAVQYILSQATDFPPRAVYWQIGLRGRSIKDPTAVQSLTWTCKLARIIYKVEC